MSILTATSTYQLSLVAVSTRTARRFGRGLVAFIFWTGRMLKLLARKIGGLPSWMVLRSRYLLLRTPFCSSKQMRALYDSKIFDLPRLHLSERYRIKRIAKHRNLKPTLAMHIASTSEWGYILDCLEKNEAITDECRVMIALRRPITKHQEDNGSDTPPPR